MRCLQKPQLKIKNILDDCVDSYRPETCDEIKKRLTASIDVICRESAAYEVNAAHHNWSVFKPHKKVNDILSEKDMCHVYDSKFVKATEIRTKYYDQIMALSTTGRCPICGIGQVSTLDHYLAKTVYPMYAITPCNLVPVCKDCNYDKRNLPIDPTQAPLHPYFDEVDSILWLKATVAKEEGGITCQFSVVDELEYKNHALYLRLKKHIELYKLNKAYAIQAACEISENILFWKEKIIEWGKDQFTAYLREILSSKESYQRNTWNTALLRALIQNVDILCE